MGECHTERANNLIERCRATVWVSCPTSNPSITVIADDNHFIWKSAIDHTDDIPERRGHIFLLVDKIEDEIIRRGANIIVDTLVFQSLVLLPMFVDVLGRWTIPIESFENRDSIDVRNWN